MNIKLLISGLMSLALLNPVFASGDFPSDDDQRDVLPPTYIADLSSDDENLSGEYLDDENIRLMSAAILNVIGDASNASLEAMMDRVPNDVWRLVFTHLPYEARLNLGQICKRFRAIMLEYACREIIPYADSSSDDENLIIKRFKTERRIKNNLYEYKKIVPDDNYINLLPDISFKDFFNKKININHVYDNIKDIYFNEPVCFTCSEPCCLSKRLDDFFEGKKPRVAKLETLLLAPEAMSDGDHLLVLTHLSPLFGTQKNVRMLSPVGNASDASLHAMGEVPNDVWKLVCFHLPDPALVNFAQTCKRFRTVALLSLPSPVRMRVTALGNAIVDQYHDRKSTNLPGIIMVDTEVGRVVWPILKKREDSKLTNQVLLLLGLTQEQN